MRTLVYRFGLLPPTENARLVDDQLRLAHRYRNDLVAIERGRRAARRALYRELGFADLEEAVARAEADVESAVKSLSAERAAGRSRKAGSDQAKARIASAKAVKKEALTAFYAAKQQFNADRTSALAVEATGDVQLDAYLTARRAYDACKSGPNSGERVALRDALIEIATAIHDAGRTGHPAANAARIDAIDLRAAALCRAARAICGVFQGTSGLVEAAMKASAKSVPLYDVSETNDPRFARWSGEGRVGVQVQQQAGRAPLLAADMFGNGTLVRIRRKAATKKDGTLLLGKRGAMRAELHLRVSSDGRAPVFASWPMILHREVPVCAVVKRVDVSRRKVGPRVEWSCEITVNIHGPSDTTRKGAVAVHFGWLERDGHIRVANWLDDSGHAGELWIHDVGLDQREASETPDLGYTEHGRGGIVSGLRKADDLRSIRGKRLDALRDGLVAWLTERTLPEWLRMLTVRRSEKAPTDRQAVHYISGWRAQARFAALCRVWERNRFDGDAEAFDMLKAWRYLDEHHWRFECDQRSGAVRRRTELYRRVAAKLTSMYGTVILDATDYRPIAKREEPEEDGSQPYSRTNRQRVAVSSLRNCIKTAAVARGVKVEPSKPASIVCPECGASHKAHVDPATRVFACSQCTFLGDVDKVALLNLLRRGGLDGAADGIMKRAKAAAAAVKEGI